MIDHPTKAEMRDPADPQYRRGRRQFTVLAIVFCTLFAASVVWQLYLISQRKASVRGDGTDPATYGFDLSNLTVDPAALVGGNVPKDGVAAIRTPLNLVDTDDMSPLKEAGANAVTTAVLDQIADGPGGAFRRVLVSDDPVIGVHINGEARCYPIRFIQWHEVVNDTLAGVPIVVTYSPLTDGVAVFERTIAGQLRTFGHAGLVYNNNLVMYDDPADAFAQRKPGQPLDPADAQAQSLWCQLAMAPIAGPAAAQDLALTPRPVWFGPWEDWRAAHPDTTAFVGDVRYKKQYKRAPFYEYFRKQEPRFPLSATSPQGPNALAPFTPIIAWQTDTGWSTTPIPPDAAPPDVPLDSPRVYTRWFAWYAIREAPAATQPVDSPPTPDVP